MKVEYKENALTAKMFNILKESVGWPALPEKQVQAAINNGYYSVVARCEGQVVGMGRLVGDGIMYWYQDMVIKPTFQRKGVGGHILDMLLSFARQNSLPNTQVTVGLMAAKGKEQFYTKHGFILRPNDIYGAGMITYIS